MRSAYFWWAASPVVPTRVPMADQDLLVLRRPLPLVELTYYSGTPRGGALTMAGTPGFEDVPEGSGRPRR